MTQRAEKMSDTLTMNDSWQERAAPAIRRGECPTLAKPMVTGDGLLARLRPLDPSLALDQMKALAEAAGRFGNGILEVTARGSLQIRGVCEDTVAPLESAIHAAGITPATGVAIETGPLSGVDPDELVDTRPLSVELRAAIAGHQPALMLAPKLAITLDGGGRFHLGDIASDIKATAFRESGGQIHFMLSVGGDGRTARRIAIREERQLVPAIMSVLELLASNGPATRGKDLDSDALTALFTYNPEVARIALPGHAPLPAGLHELAHQGMVLGLALPYCQIDATDLIACLDQLKGLGASEIRLAPGHGLFVLGLSKGNIERAAQAARASGFWISTDEPRQHVALCAGARGCASAYYDTRAVAEAVMAAAPELLDGSFFLHLSGCAKGCAHPARAALTLAGTPTGYGLVVNGAASSPPDAYIAASDLKPALQGLASLLKRSMETGETVRDCLARLGANRIAAALQLDLK
jgi:precorrin-3B synthase